MAGILHAPAPTETAPRAQPSGEFQVTGPAADPHPLEDVLTTGHGCRRRSEAWPGHAPAAQGGHPSGRQESSTPAPDSIETEPQEGDRYGRIVSADRSVGHPPGRDRLSARAHLTEVRLPWEPSPCRPRSCARGNRGAFEGPEQLLHAGLSLHSVRPRSVSPGPATP